MYGCHITAPHSSIVINPEHAIQSKYILNYTCANHDKQKKAKQRWCLCKTCSLFEPDTIIQSFLKSSFLHFFLKIETSKISQMKPHLLRINSSNPQCLQLFLLYFELAMLQDILPAAAHSKHCNPVKLFLCWVGFNDILQSKIRILALTCPWTKK